MDIHWWNHSPCHFRSSGNLTPPLHLDRELFRVSSQPLWNHPSLWVWQTQRICMSLGSQLTISLTAGLLPAENTSTGTFVLLVSSRRSWVPSRRASAYSLAKSSKSFGSNGKPLKHRTDLKVIIDYQLNYLAYLMRSPLSVHQSTILAFFSVWLKFGSISMGRYFSNNFFDPSRNEVGTDLHRLNMPKLDSVGFPWAVICLVSVKSKSVTTCNSLGPPWTISFMICSTRCRSRILQCGWFNASISCNWIGRCVESVAIVLTRHNIGTRLLLVMLMLTFVNVAPIASNCWPTKSLNLYACSAKSKYKYFSKSNGIRCW